MAKKKRKREKIYRETFLNGWKTVKKFCFPSFLMKNFYTDFIIKRESTFLYINTLGDGFKADRFTRSPLFKLFIDRFDLATITGTLIL